MARMHREEPNCALSALGTRGSESEAVFHHHATLPYYFPIAPGCVPAMAFPSFREGLQASQLLTHMHSPPPLPYLSESTAHAHLGVLHERHM
jgi:hypothetical protein